MSPLEAYLGRVCRKSRNSLRSALETIAKVASRGWKTAATYDFTRVAPDLPRIRDHLSRMSPATENHYLCALRGILREHHRRGDLDRWTYERLLRRLRGLPHPRWYLATGEVVRPVVRGSDDDAAGDL